MVLKSLRDAGYFDYAQYRAEWMIHYAFFARTGFSDAARREAATHDALLVDLATLDDDLRREMS